MSASGWVLAAVAAVSSLVPAPAAQARAVIETAAVLAPLTIDTQAEMATFERLLDDARRRGVDTVSIDVWWGRVERDGDQRFDWSYYDDVFARITERGLKLAPILSFHGCGGGPGDDCDIPVPAWLYASFAAEGLAPDDLRYESETGRRQQDAIAPWATAYPAVLRQYRELMAAFRDRYAKYARQMTEINVSLGPTGELRYPSYNFADGWNYPQRGFFQAYSRLAEEDFRAWALKRFGGLAGVEKRWGVRLESADAILPPGGDLDPAAGPRAQGFVDRVDYLDTTYGRDFVDWYNGSLVAHGRRLLTTADRVLQGTLRGVPLGMKIPGIHWQILPCSERPRIAEITAGLVRSSGELGIEGRAARRAAWGYRAILDMVAEVERKAERPIILHFTAAEIDDDTACGPGGNSLAQSLVRWISIAAKDRGLAHKAENALACVDNPGDDRSWENVRFVFRRTAYTGFALLRLSGDPTCGEGRSPWDVDGSPYASLIRDFSKR